MRYLMLLCIGVSALTQVVVARPVSYPGGITADAKNNGDEHSLLIHYSPTAKYSVGIRSEYRRKEKISLTSFQLNNLVKRWNQKKSQANLYIKSGVGYTNGNSSRFENNSSLAAYSGISLDWETRRYFAGYENRYLDVSDITDFFVQKARIGIAPYIADFGALHTWLMLEVEHDPEGQNTFSVTPVVRIFKDVYRAEAGISNHNDVTFNFTIRF